MAENVQAAEPTEKVAQAGEASAPSKWQRLVVAVVCAVVVALALQGITMARNNYSLWRLEFTAIDVVVALVASLAADLVGGLDERGHRWAQDNLLKPGTFAYRVVQALPSALVRGALIAACAAIPNATYVTMVIYREKVESPVLAVIARFLSDIPQAVLLCLVVTLLVQWCFRRKASAAA